LQAAFAELGISEAQLVQAALPPSPTVSFGQISYNAALEIERTILVNVLALLTLPKRQEIAHIKREQAITKAHLAIMATAQQTRRAYYDALFTSETIKHLEESQRVAKTLSVLIKRLGETGAANKLQQAREHVFYAEIAAQAGSARLMHQANLEKLTRVLGRLN
jgi:outer membrane protein TolC